MSQKTPRGHTAVSAGSFGASVPVTPGEKQSFQNVMTIKGGLGGMGITGTDEVRASHPPPP